MENEGEEVVYFLDTEDGTTIDGIASEGETINEILLREGFSQERIDKLTIMKNAVVSDSTDTASGDSANPGEMHLSLQLKIKNG